MTKAHETILEINLKALKHNFEHITSKINNSAKLMAVVKAYGYGSDASVIAKHLQELNVDYFAVAYVSEGVVLRNVGIIKPILVLHPQPINFKTLIQHCLEPNLYNAKSLNEFIKVSSEENQTKLCNQFSAGRNVSSFICSISDFLESLV